jgi:hypothetical protein
VIPSNVATPFIKRHHYSGKVVNNSVLHFGVFLDGRLHGVMSYGPSLVKAHIIGLVTAWPLIMCCRATAKAAPLR